jgi:hypothetical protein
MGKKKTKGTPPPEERKFKGLLRRLVAVSREELAAKQAEYERDKSSRRRS